MEERDLLKERLQAITEKHRIQEDIRQKKLELDQEKLKLQHLKKKALREQWLLRDSHNAADCTQQQSLLPDQQQTRALQLSIHRIEMEVESLEREESMISTKESFVLNRLKAVEKSPEDIIKEAHDSFVPEPLQVTTVISDVPESRSPPASEPSKPNTPSKTLFAMEINVTKSTLTGESRVLSTADVPPEELDQLTGLKVYDDGRKCVYALSSQEGSHDQSYVSELSASEVKHLLRSATVNRQVKHQNYLQHPRRREEQCFSNHQHERGRVEEHDLRNQAEHYDEQVLRRHIAEKDFSSRETWQRKPRSEDHYGNQESRYIRNEGRNKQSNLKERRHKELDHHCRNQQDCHYSSYQVRNCHSVQEGGSTSHHPNGITRSSSRMNGSGSNGYPPLRSYDQDHMTPSYIPPIDYISEEEHYCYSPPSYQPNRKTENSHNQSTARYSGPTYCDRVPSPLYRDDPPYTILNALDTTEPITAIFMGFQTAQDDSGQVQEFEGSLKAELVIIEDHEDSSMKEKKSCTHIPSGSASNGTVGHVQGVGDRRGERRVGPGIRKIQKKQPCCSVC